HSFGSILYSKGVDIVTISKLMGHSSIEITVKLYVHDDMTLMQNAIETGFSGG
ncbi:tyrosine-type recombinase/integrase, partial [Christensenella minuta]|uniref:tyrosine-type recombinase/integrase n=1 Tax=Christensenella minuta TaxID=626937 RepID=UPI0039C8DD59